MVGLGDGDGAIENVKGMDGIVDIHHLRLRVYAINHTLDGADVVI